MKETELAKHFIGYLSCYDLYFEVDYYRSVDVVAIAEKYSISVEVKTSFNFKVLEQAIENSKHFNYSYIAVPKTNDMYFYIKLCEDYGLGLLVYNDYINEVRERLAPKLNRHCSLSHLKKRLSERNKQSVAGSKNGESGKITAFGVTKDSAIKFVKRYGKNGCTIDDLISGITHHYNTDKAAKTNLYNWIKTGIINDLRIENKRIYLNEPF